MKICKNCGAEIQDGAAFCTHCGTKVEEQKVEEQRVEPEKTEQTARQVESEQTSDQSQAEGQNAGAQNVNYGQGQNYGQNPNYGQSQNYGQQGGYQPNYTPYDPYDHTPEFTAKDISDNKVIAMLVYLMGTVGIIVALLASKDSPYLSFHVRQALKFTVLEVLTGIITLLLFWTFIVPIAAGIFGIVLFVCKIIAFFSICKGNAKEPYVVRSFNFLK